MAAPGAVALHLPCALVFFLIFPFLFFSFVFQFSLSSARKASKSFSRNTMGSKADDVSYGGATAAVLLDDPSTEEKRDGPCVVRESKDETARSAEAAGKFGSIGAPPSEAFACHRKILVPRRPKEDCVEEELRLRRCQRAVRLHTREEEFCFVCLAHIC